MSTQLGASPLARHTTQAKESPMSNLILRNEPLGHPWPGTDPFLFCAYHLDQFPPATADQAVDMRLLGGRELGHDFSGKDGFSMYHGVNVPGFPAHPHRGFETITIVPKGVVDHADSLGATARYGDGDVQWLTAGSGIQHSEMFPLRSREQGNPLELYQIWLNLPARSKMADPEFVMLWGENIPKYRSGGAEVNVIAGRYQPQEAAQAEVVALAPGRNSWAANPDADLAVWQITLQPGASLTLPAASRPGTRRTLYFHDGRHLQVDGSSVAEPRLLEVAAGSALPLHNGGSEVVQILLLQGVPIAEPVVAYGPFVMNSAEEIEQTRRDYGRTQFGGWPWSGHGPVHPAGQGRFARHPGSEVIEEPPAK